MRIGVIGAGIMGHGMALNLLRAGHGVCVVAHRNRQPIDDLVAQGAREIESVEAMATTVDGVLICVTGSPAAREVIGRIAPGLAADALVIDCTTNAPEAPAEFATLLGVRYVEAPVTGGAVQAREGVLGAIVGCDASGVRARRQKFSPPSVDRSNASVNRAWARKQSWSATFSPSARQRW